MNVGRVVGGALLGMLFLLFVALDLVLFGVLPLNRPVYLSAPRLATKMLSKTCAEKLGSAPATANAAMPLAFSLSA